MQLDDAKLKDDAFWALPAGLLRQHCAPCPVAEKARCRSFGSKGRDVLEARTFGFKCLTSFCDGYEGVKEETERHLAAGYGFEFVWCKALKKYVIIVETEQDVTVPSCIIGGFGRSGVNSKSVCPVRII